MLFDGATHAGFYTRPRDPLPHLPAESSHAERVNAERYDDVASWERHSGGTEGQVRKRPNHTCSRDVPRAIPPVPRPLTSPQPAQNVYLYIAQPCASEGEGYTPREGGGSAYMHHVAQRAKRLSPTRRSLL